MNYVSVDTLVVDKYILASMYRVYGFFGTIRTEMSNSTNRRVRAVAVTLRLTQTPFSWSHFGHHSYLLRYNPTVLLQLARSTRKSISHYAPPIYHIPRSDAQKYVTQMLSSSWNIITSLWNASHTCRTPLGKKLRRFLKLTYVA